MKLQIFYVIGMFITMFLAYRVMSKVKDTPQENDNEEQPAESEEPEEDDSNSLECEKDNLL